MLSFLELLPRGVVVRAQSSGGGSVSGSPKPQSQSLEIAFEVTIIETEGIIGEEGSNMNKANRYAARTGSSLDRDLDSLECLIYCLVGFYTNQLRNLRVGHQGRMRSYPT